MRCIKALQHDLNRADVKLLLSTPLLRVLAFCAPLVEEMASLGTTTLELKTGYGLSVEAELRQARLARELASRAPQSCTVTLLACHAVPEGRTRAAWVAEVCTDLIPAAADLVDAVDVYVEDIAFSLDDLERFRQWGSLTPGHPEVHHTPGIEVTTGPLGQGVGQVAAATTADANTISGSVLEQLPASPYVYLKLKTATGDVWVAVPEAKIAVGTPVTVYGALAMGKFESKTLNRTFDEVYFGNLTPPEAPPAGGGVRAHGRGAARARGARAQGPQCVLT